MILRIEQELVPLKADSDGVVRVGNTRIRDRPISTIFRLVLFFPVRL